ncbi:hypothetical protein [Lentzea flava]|uniref:hypothetical protein n=1 Tax=Lentzea flava TaxID=103732 RepID=UPI0016704CC3|nr:hypothetical protein [Lentzea flava]
MQIRMESPTGVYVLVSARKAERLYANGYLYLDEPVQADEDEAVDEQPALPLSQQPRRRGRPPKSATADVNEA